MRSPVEENRSAVRRIFPSICFVSNYYGITPVILKECNLCLDRKSMSSTFYSSADFRLALSSFKKALEMGFPFVGNIFKIEFTNFYKNRLTGGVMHSSTCFRISRNNIPFGQHSWLGAPTIPDFLLCAHTCKRVQHL